MSQARDQYDALDAAITVLAEEARRMPEPEPSALELGRAWKVSETQKLLSLGPAAIPALYARLRTFWHRYRTAWLAVIDHYVPSVYLVPPADIEPTVKSLWDAAWEHGASDASNAVASVEKGVEEVYQDARKLAEQGGQIAWSAIETVAEPVIEQAEEIADELRTARAIGLAVVGVGVGFWLLSYLPRR